MGYVRRKIPPKVNSISGGIMAHDDDSEIAQHIERYGALFAQQVERAGGWPEKFSFPEPADEAQREALRLFTATLGDMTGTKITVQHKGRK
jgi:hypothetical protein